MGNCALNRTPGLGKTRAIIISKITQSLKYSLAAPQLARGAGVSLQGHGLLVCHFETCFSRPLRTAVPLPGGSFTFSSEVAPINRIGRKAF